MRNIIRHKGYAFLNIFGLAAGTANILAGEGAGASITTAQNNTAIGYNALSSNTSAANNNIVSVFAH